MKKPNTIQVSYDKLISLGYCINHSNVTKDEEKTMLRDYLNTVWAPAVRSFEYEKVRGYIIIKNINWIEDHNLIQLVSISYDKKDKKVLAYVKPNISKEKAIQLMKDTIKIYEEDLK